MYRNKPKLILWWNIFWRMLPFNYGKQKKNEQIDKIIHARRRKNGKRTQRFQINKILKNFEIYDKRKMVLKQIRII